MSHAKINRRAVSDGGWKIDSHPPGDGSFYWIKNLINPVRFSDAVIALVQLQHKRGTRHDATNVDIVVELDPQSVLWGSVERV